MGRYKSYLNFIRYALDPKGGMPEDVAKMDWEGLFQFADEQGILGVMFDGRRKMFDGRREMEEGFLDDLTLEWGFVAQEIERKNKEVNKAAVKLSKELKEKGFECCILKGQGNNLLYPNVYSRTPGDIDVWVKKEDGRCKRDDVRGVIRFVKERNPEARAIYHHIDYGEYDGIEVEVHYRPSFMNNPIHNHRLQKWFEKMAPEQFAHIVELPHTERLFTNTDRTDNTDFKVCVPTGEFNLVFQMSHVYNHLLHEGIGMRQISDYYYLLKTNTDRTDETDVFNGTQRHRDTKDIKKLLRRLGLWKIAGAMMWVMSEVLGLEEKYLIAPKDERLGKVLLGEIIRGGNFGQFDTDNILADNQLKKNWQRLKRDFRMMRYFPSECLWEPVFRMWHFFWRIFYA